MLGRLNLRLTGFRTYIGAAALGVPSMLALFGVIDLTPLLSVFIKDPQKLYAASMMVGGFFALMRAITHTSPGGVMSTTQTAPMFKKVDDGA